MKSGMNCRNSDVISIDGQCWFCGCERDAEEVFMVKMYGNHVQHTKRSMFSSITHHSWLSTTICIPCCMTCKGEITRSGKLIQRALPCLFGCFAFLATVMLRDELRVFVGSIVGLLCGYVFYLVLRDGKANWPRYGLRIAQYPVVRKFSDSGWKIGEGPLRFGKRHC